MIIDICVSEGRQARCKQCVRRQAARGNAFSTPTKTKTKTKMMMIMMMIMMIIVLKMKMIMRPFQDCDDSKHSLPETQCERPAPDTNSSEW